MRKIIYVLLAALFALSAASCGLYHTHVYSEKVSRTEPTCEKDGYVVMQCECGDQTRQSLPATGHKYVSKVIKEATCTVEGKTKYTCSVCGKSYEEKTTKSHSYDSTKHCTMCGKLKEGKIKTDYRSYSDYSWGGSYGTRFKITSMDYKTYTNGIEVTVAVKKTYDYSGSTATNPIFFYISIEKGFSVIENQIVSIYGLKEGQSKTEKVQIFFTFDPTEDYTIRISES